MKLLKDLIIIKIIIFMKSLQTNDDNNELTSSPFQWCSHYYPCQAPVSKTWGWSNQNKSISQSHTSLRWLSIQNSSISSHAQDVNDKQDVIFVIPMHRHLESQLCPGGHLSFRNNSIWVLVKRLTRYICQKMYVCQPKHCNIHIC